MATKTKNKKMYTKSNTGNPKRGGQGFLLSCETGQERKCQREALDILRFYYSQKNNLNDNEKSSKKLVLNLEQEISMLNQGLSVDDVLQPNNKSSFPFQIYNTKCKGTVFIMYTPTSSSSSSDTTTDTCEQDTNDGKNSISPSTSFDNNNDKKRKVDDCQKTDSSTATVMNKKQKVGLPSLDHHSWWDPTETVKQIIMDIQNDDLTTTANIPSSRFVIRMIPIQVTCFSAIKEVIDTARMLLQTKLIPIGIANAAAKKPQPKFKIEFKRRNCSNMKRESIISAIADLVTELSTEATKSEKEEEAVVKPLFTVDLKNPDYTILIEICHTLCGMSIVPNPKAFTNFNLIAIQEKAKSESETKATQTDTTHND